MKILNRILNIVILIASIAAAVFSFFLFQRRNQLVTGWGQMAAAIQNAAKTIDNEGKSGTTAVNDLPADQLKYSTYEKSKLDGTLTKLPANIKKIVEQRNDMASTMHATAGVVYANDGITVKGLQNIGTYPRQKTLLQNNFRTINTRISNISQSYNSTIKQLGISAYFDFKNPVVSQRAVTAVNKAIIDLKDKNNVYRNYLIRFSQAIGIAQPDLSDAKYKSSLNTTLVAFRNHQGEFNKTKGLLRAEQAKTKNLEKQNKDLAQRFANTVAEKDRKIKEAQKEAESLRDILSMNGKLDIPKKLTAADKEECYKYIKGKIEYIDEEYGFLTINIGKNFIITQQIGIKENKFNFPLEVGNILHVYRKAANGKPECIGQVIVTKVDDDFSICAVYSKKEHEPLPINSFKVGDHVSFMSPDPSAVSASKKK